jgi:hypothetical protein
MGAALEPPPVTASAAAGVVVVVLGGVVLVGVVVVVVLVVVDVVVVEVVPETDTVDELFAGFGSLLSDAVMVAVLSRAPEKPAETFTVRVKLIVSVLERLDRVAVTVPVPPTAGVVNVARGPES